MATVYPTKAEHAFLTALLHGEYTPTLNVAYGVNTVLTCRDRGWIVGTEASGYDLTDLGRDIIATASGRPRPPEARKRIVRRTLMQALATIVCEDPDITLDEIADVTHLPLAHLSGAIRYMVIVEDSTNSTQAAHEAAEQLAELTHCPTSNGIYGYCDEACPPEHQDSMTIGSYIAATNDEGAAS